jgi:hypothetical protein
MGSMKFIKYRNRILNESREISQEDLDWVDMHVRGGSINEDGEIVTTDGSVNLMRKANITHFPVKFADCAQFSISDCPNLESLHNSPNRVRTSFFAGRCNSLVDLKGISKYIGKDLFLDSCAKLRSFEGLEEVKGVIMATGCVYPENVLISCWEKGITPDELENFKSDWEI